jgi:hypothetical protein
MDTTVSNGTVALDESSLRIGLLMESAQAQQKLAETQLEKLAAHTQGLDEVVRDEIRRTLIDELQAVTAESRRAAEVLRRMQRAGNLRAALFGLGVSAFCAGIPGAAAWWALPAPGELMALRAQRDQAAADLKRLRQQGGRVDLRRCGETQRLCVRIERHAPAYGESADYFVVKGY